MGRRSSIIRDLRRWFFPRDKWRNVPNQLINDGRRMRGAKEQERMVIRYNLARSPKEARRLMVKHNVYDADDLLDILRPYKLTLFKKFRIRLVKLIRKIDGHDPRDLIQYKKYEDRI